VERGIQGIGKIPDAVLPGGRRGPQLVECWVWASCCSDKTVAGFVVGVIQIRFARPPKDLCRNRPGAIPASELLRASR